MAKFDAATQVEKLEYDFTAYGGGEGDITEPSTGTVNGFFANMRKMVKEVQSLQGTIDEIDVEELDEGDLTEQVEAMDEATVGASKFQMMTIAALAELCGGVREFVEDPENPDGVEIEVVTGGSPSFDELEKLPYRVLQAFSTWLMGEIRPKATTPATPRSPQDRRRRTT